MSRIVVPAINQLDPEPSVFTIGAFDGVHRGHQHLLGQARMAAERDGARVVAITFEPLPVQVFRPDAFPGRILTPQRRRELLWHYGADAIVELQFAREMAQETAAEFIAEMRAVGPVREIWVGDDFALGHNREGTPSRLQELLSDDGSLVHAIPRISWERREVSSTAIRNHLITGAAREASILMGHRFEITGEVVQGAQLGREIGFPTANVAPPAGIVALKDGIYVSYARVGESVQRLPAMTYIGTRPAVNTGERMIETHLLDFDADIYGQQLTAEFITHLRPDSDFPSLDALVTQLGHDEGAARTVLEQEEAPEENQP